MKQLIFILVLILILYRLVFFWLPAFYAFLYRIMRFSGLKKILIFPRLLFYLNLFAFSLNGIFLSPNIFQTYIFLETAGIASYLLINFDFSNREQSKAGIKSFIYNRTGDLTLLFCVLTIMYYSVVYNELSGVNALSYANMNNIAASINSLMNTPLFVFFCSVLIFVIVMKFMQAFVYITFESRTKNVLSNIVLMQNSILALTGVFLFIRFNRFSSNWGQTGLGRFLCLH